MEQIITLTPAAAAKLRAIFDDKENEGHVLRVYVMPGGCSGFSYGMSIENETSDEDVRSEQDGVTVVVDPMSAQYVKGSEIDFSDALMGGGFSLRNPNAVSTCGCGQSFRTGEERGGPKPCH